MPRSPKFVYDYQKGAPWMHETLIAQFDFPILKTDEQILSEREAAASDIIPYYRLDKDVSLNSQKLLYSVDMGNYAFIRPVLADLLSSVYSKGVISMDPGAGLESDGVSGQGLIYVQKDRRAARTPASEVYTVAQAISMVRDTLSVRFPGAALDSLMTAFRISEMISPDLIYDQQTTDLVHEQRVDFVSGTSGVGRSGQVIVSEGEIITSEIEQMLRSYETEYVKSVGYNGNEMLQWLGNILIALFMVIVLFLAILYCNSRIFGEYNKYLYLLLVFSLAAGAAALAARYSPSLFYMIPFTLVALYLLAFFKKRVVFTVYIISLLPILVFASNGMELFFIYLTAGVVGMLVFGYFNRGWLQFVTAFIVFIVMVAVWFAFRLADGLSGVNEYGAILNMALAAFLSVAGYPMVFLFEKIFALVSNSKLVELSDTGNPLLRQLADKAPGTFHHSLQVMNLADAAARSIGANVLLVRAGALYHDIGKMANPQCFTENESGGVRYHEGLSPKESAKDIIRHIADGIEAAEKHNLPEVIKDFIRTHHGTSAAGYFLTTYLNGGGDPEDVEDFYYKGIRPMTKEQVVLMICDSVEAASRSLKDYSYDTISALVDRLVDSKIADGQFADADISLKEVEVVKKEIKAYLQQMYHTRIAYPKREGK
jgi:putative nucleotidyltransferase with HDIG domain